MLIALLGGYVAQVLFRLWFIQGRVGPLAIPDESGYLINARILSGVGPGVPTLGMNYHGGYSILIAPVFWISHDPATVYRLVLAENAILSSLVLPLTYVLARRVFGFPPLRATAVAFAVTTLPAIAFYSGFALSDAVLPVLVTAWLLTLGLWFQEGRHPAVWATTGALLVAYTFTVHSRGMVLAFIEVCILVAVATTSPSRRRAAITAFSTLVIGLGCAEIFNLWMAAQNHPPTTALALASALTGGPSHLDAALRTLGAIWAMNVSTLGLGLTAMTAGLWVAARTGERSERRMVVVATLLAVAAIAVAAPLEVADEHRVGNWVYSRYLSCFVPTLVVIGIYALTRCYKRGRRTGRRAIGVATLAFLVLSVIVYGWAGHRLDDYSFIQADFPESMPLTWTWNHFDLLGAAVVVVAVLIVGTLATRRISASAVIVVIALCVGGSAAVGIKEHVIDPWDSWAWPLGETHLARAGVGPDARLCTVLDSWFKRTSLAFEAYWVDVPMISDLTQLSNCDAVAVPVEVGATAAQQRQGIGTLLRSQGWRIASGDVQWDIWVHRSPTGPIR